MRSGFRIQLVPCPRCAIKRTARVDAGWFICFNCRLQWGEHAPTPAAARLFGATERARLEAYRAAVRAGLFSDWPSGVAESAGASS